MAARLKGSGADGLVLYNAPDWHERVHLMKRDCVVDTIVLSNIMNAVNQGTAMFMPNGAVASYPTPVAETTLMENNVIQGSSVVSWDARTMTCVQSGSANTMVDSSLHPSYNTSATILQARNFWSILMKEQPFAYAGDVTLTAEHSANGEYWVSVDRLFGNEVNEYTMVNVRAKFPANPPADTIKIGGQLYEQVDRLPIPYSFSDMGGVQHPAVSTPTSVFFAVNPSLAMFKCLARGCASEGYEWCTQLSALSSYAPIKVTWVPVLVHIISLSLSVHAS